MIWTDHFMRYFRTNRYQGLAKGKKLREQEEV